MKLTPEEAERFWVETDVNNDGALTVQELRAGVNACQRKYNKPEFDDQQLCAMFISISGSVGGDKISKEKFMEEMAMDRESDLKEFFKAVDVNSDGYLSHDEIRQLIKNAGLCENAAEDILASADPNNDGKVTWEEFQNCV